jgi:hypothetical protein
MKTLLVMKPNFDWNKRGIISYLHKCYPISCKDIIEVMVSQEKIQYFAEEHDVRIHVINESGNSMILIIFAQFR